MGWPFKRENADEKRHREIINRLNQIMSAISEYAAKVNASFDAIQATNDALATAIGGIADDVLFLKETIEAIQNNPGPVTPEDQALLDASESRLATLATNLGALKTAAEQLDAATERPAPPTP